MKAQLTKSINEISKMEFIAAMTNKSETNKFFVYSLQLVLLFVLVFATVSGFAQAPAKAIETQEVKQLEFVKQTAISNSGRVYINWVAKADAPDCIYVVERSVNGTEYEPIGLKEGIHSPLELLYSWVDTKPVNGEIQYRIKQINEEGQLVAQSAQQTIQHGNSSPLFLDRGNRMVSAH